MQMKLMDVVIAGHFFKHSVMMLDAVEAQMSHGAVFSAGVSARSMLEAYIYLAWILEKDTENRARHFYVWHLRQKREWARRLIKGTLENDRFEPHIANLYDLQDPCKRAALEKEAKKRESDISRFLSSAINKEVNDAFDKLKKRYDVAWYRPCGPSSIRQVADAVKLEAEYDFFYSHFSDISHAGAFDKHVKICPQGIVFEPIRSPEGIRTLVNIVATLAFRTYRLIIKKYFPQEVQSFNFSYVTKWRARFQSVPDVVVKEPDSN